ncbi:MAG: hypothetical protein H0V03_10680 [Thermoleophilaceae bacterium]|nr:hypothetical protein [Thermoleophilaceae bacterium]
MPIYEYRCERGHSFECMQRMGADAIEACTVCGAPATRVFSAPAVHFKGSGFYTTDYGKKGRGGASDNGGDGAKETGSDSKAGSSSDSSNPGSDSKSSSDSKSGSKAGSTSSGSSSSD